MIKFIPSVTWLYNKNDIIATILLSEFPLLYRQVENWEISSRVQSRLSL